MYFKEWYALNPLKVHFASATVHVSIQEATFAVLNTSL